MTKSQKITLSASRDIPFNKLVLSQSNVRRVKAGVSIDELAEDIARRTLLSSITVRPVLDEDGAETGMFEIPAGGRRYRALELLVKQKRLNRTAPVPCIVRTDGLAEEDSLAENVQRAPLHPLDQFRAFQAMREKGKSEEEIAAALFVSANVVKQRLRPAAYAPPLPHGLAEGRTGGDHAHVVPLLLDGADQHALRLVVTFEDDGHDGPGSDHVHAPSRQLDDLGVLQDALEVQDPALHLALLLLGGVVVAVLGEVAQFAGRLDLAGDVDASAGGEVLVLGGEAGMRVGGELLWFRHDRSVATLWCRDAARPFDQPPRGLGTLRGVSTTRPVIIIS